MFHSKLQDINFTTKIVFKLLLKVWYISHCMQQLETVHTHRESSPIRTSQINGNKLDNLLLRYLLRFVLKFATLAKIRLWRTSRLKTKTVMISLVRNNDNGHLTYQYLKSICSFPSAFNACAQQEPYMLRFYFVLICSALRITQYSCYIFNSVRSLHTVHIQKYIASHTRSTRTTFISRHC